MKSYLGDLDLTEDQRIELLLALDDRVDVLRARIRQFDGRPEFEEAVQQSREHLAIAIALMPVLSPTWTPKPEPVPS